MRPLYVLGRGLYVLLVHVAAAWNPKAKKWVAGRRTAWTMLENFSSSRKKAVKTYWFHCASLGEFEQGRPLMEALKSKEDCRLVVTFFSPSGYEIRKNYELADLVLYLPNDNRKNARRFLDHVQPDRIFFIKYEFWADYIFEAQQRKIPLYSVSAVFRANQVFFKWYGGYMRKVLAALTAIFVQDEASASLLKTIGIKSHISGDTRYDRVMGNAAKAKRFPLIDQFAATNKIAVCGSVWEEDVKVVADSLRQFLNKGDATLLTPPSREEGQGWKIIIAPHEISERHINLLEEKFPGAVRYSKLSAENSNARILIIDNIGMLMHLYGYADLAYVGGAFKTGLHNILEPASFGLPVIFGPHHQKFPEAQLFIDNGIGFSISSAPGFETVLNDLAGKNDREKVLNFMRSKQGATERILGQL